MSKYRTRKEWNWEVEIECVPFPNEQQKERSYDLYAESILNAYRNWLKLQEKQAEKERSKNEG